jgi:hypothetical protein
METKRRAPDEIAARQRAADEKRKEEAKKRRQQITADAINQPASISWRPDRLSPSHPLSF